MNMLLILNDAPYGTERSYNGLRLAASLARQHDVTVRVFMVGDAVACAKRGQNVPAGYYNIERMTDAVVRHGGAVGLCGSCLDARGIGEAEIVAGAHRSSLEELTAWTVSADKVVAL